MSPVAQPISVMIVAPPGIWRDALVSLVRAQENLALSAVADNLPAVRAKIETEPLHVLIADIVLGESQLAHFTGWLHDAYPGVRSVVAVDMQHQQASSLAAGANATLLKGCLDEALLKEALAA